MLLLKQCPYTVHSCYTYQTSINTVLTTPIRGIHATVSIKYTQNPSSFQHNQTHHPNLGPFQPRFSLPSQPQPTHYETHQIQLYLRNQKKKSKKIPLSVQNQVSRTKEKTSFLESTPYHSAALTSRIQKPIRRLREEYSALITGTGPACCM